MPLIFGNNRGFSEFLGFFPLHKEIDLFGGRINDTGDEFKSKSRSETREVGVCCIFYILLLDDGIGMQRNRIDNFV
jgi:hypothetical protein